jgi:similar to spore coat protein
MNTIIEKLTGMDKMSDQVIATDFLITAKNGVRNYAMALTESATPEVREVLKRQLRDTIATHEAITGYMMKNGYYHAYNPQEQYKVDMTASDTALGLANKGSKFLE